MTSLLNKLAHTGLTLYIFLSFPYTYTYSQLPHYPQNFYISTIIPYTQSRFIGIFRIVSRICQADTQNFFQRRYELHIKSDNDLFMYKPHAYDLFFTILSQKLGPLV